MKLAVLVSLVLWAVSARAIGFGVFLVIILAIAALLTVGAFRLIRGGRGPRPSIHADPWGERDDA